MKIRHYMTAFVLAVFVAGCQTGQPMPKSSAMDNSAFMVLWGTYRHCERGTDPELMRVDAQQLNTVATASRSTIDGDVPLPTVIRRWMSEPANRLAVDPKAMAAACSLHTGEAALSVGRYDIAGEMFSLVSKYPEGAYSYYVNQARDGLARIDVEAKVSSRQIGSPRLVSLPPQPVPVR